MQAGFRSILRKEHSPVKKKTVEFSDDLTQEKKFIKPSEHLEKNLADVVCGVPGGKRIKTDLFGITEKTCNTNTSNTFSYNFIKDTLEKVKEYDFIKIIIMSSISTILGKTHRFENEGYFSLLHHLTEDRDIKIESKSNEGVGISVTFYIKDNQYKLFIDNKRIKERGTTIRLNFENEPFTEDETDEIKKEINKLKFVQQIKIRVDIWDEDYLEESFIVNEDFSLNDDELTISLMTNLDSTEFIIFKDEGFGVSRQDFINYSLVPYTTSSNNLRDSSMKITRDEEEKRINFNDISGVYDSFSNFYIVVGNFIHFECESKDGVVIFFETYEEYNNNVVFFEKVVEIVSDHKTDSLICLTKLSDFDNNKKIIVQEIIRDALSTGDIMPKEFRKYTQNTNQTFISIPDSVPYAPTLKQEKLIEYDEEVGDKKIIYNDEVFQETNIGLPYVLVIKPGYKYREVNAVEGTKLERSLQRLMTKKNVDPELFLEFLDKILFSSNKKLNNSRKNRYMRHLYYYLSKTDKARLVLPNWFQFKLAKNKKFSNRASLFIYQTQLEFSRYAQYGRIMLPFAPDISSEEIEQTLDLIEKWGIYEHFEVYINFCFIVSGIHKKSFRDFYQRDFDLLKNVFAFKTSFNEYISPLLQKKELTYLPLATKGKEYNLTARMFMSAVASGHEEISFEEISKIKESSSKLFENLLERKQTTPFKILEILFKTFSGEFFDVTIQETFISFYTPDMMDIGFGVFLPYFNNSLFFLYGDYKVYVEICNKNTQYFIEIVGEKYRIFEKKEKPKEYGVQVTLFLPGTSFLREIKKYYGIIEELYVNEKRVNFDIIKIYEDSDEKVFYDSESSFPSYIFVDKRPFEKLDVHDFDFEEKLVLSQGFVFEMNTPKVTRKIIESALVRAVARIIVKKSPGVIQELSDYFMNSRKFLRMLKRRKGGKYSKILLDKITIPENDFNNSA